jgi:hypothetical protein
MVGITAHETMAFANHFERIGPGAGQYTLCFADRGITGFAVEFSLLPPQTFPEHMNFV